MKWFKFYGQDWLTDTKVMQMSVEDRLCFITLLCLASSADEGGLIRNCDEYTLIRLTQLPDNIYEPDHSPFHNASGCLKRYEALHCVTLGDNGDVTVVNFGRRQDQNLSNAERQKRYRERHKLRIKPRNDSNVTLGNDSNARIEKRNARVTQNRKDNIGDKKSPKKKMKKNKMGKYSENDHSDEYEDVIDIDSGSLKIDPQDEINQKVTLLLEWAEKERGKPFMDKPTQRKMIHDLRKQGIPPDIIKRTFKELLASDYWKAQPSLPDFKTVFSALKNKK